MFSLVTVVLFFLAATLVLHFLEKSDRINVNRADDRPVYLPSDTFQETRKGSEDWITITDEYMVRQTFLKTKPKTTFRIFVTGGSFAQGTPYVYQTAWVEKHPEANILGYGGIGDWLLAELEIRYPSKHFEMINASANG